MAVFLTEMFTVFPLGVMLASCVARDNFGFVVCPLYVENFMLVIIGMSEEIFTVNSQG